MSNQFFILLFCLTLLGQIQGAENKAAEPVRKIRGKAVFGDDVNNPVPGVMVSYRSSGDLMNQVRVNHSINQSISFDSVELKADENGDFEIRALGDPVYVEVLTPDRRFGKMVIVQPTESEFIASLEPTASVHGKIVDTQSEKPLIGRIVNYSLDVPVVEGSSMSTSGFKRETKTNEKGEYEFHNLPTGVVSNVDFPFFFYGEDRSYGSSTICNTLELQPAENRKLEDHKYALRRSGYEEYKFQMYEAYSEYVLGEPSGNLLEQQFKSRLLLERRFKSLTERAKRDGKNGVFVILVQGKSDEEDLGPLREIYRTLFGEDDMFAQTERFNMMCVLMQPKEEMRYEPTPAMAQVFVKTRKINEPLPSLFSFAFFDTNGKLLGVEPFDHTATPATQKQELIEMLKKY